MRRQPRPPASEPEKRKPGRPRRTAGESGAPSGLSTGAVVDCAYRLCATTRLDDLTLNQIARELDVSTTTVRHHIKDRKALTKALIDRYFEDLRGKLPPLTGDWKADFDNFLWTQISVHLSRPGIVSYFFEHRFAPEIDPFGGDDATHVTKTMLRILRQAGLDAANAALAWHMILHLLLSVGYADARGQTPARQVAVFERMRAVGGKDSDDRAVVAALSQVNLPMIFDVISNMLRHAIEVRFDFSDAAAAARMAARSSDRNVGVR